MNKIKLNYFVDIGLALSFLVVFITGLLKTQTISRFLELATNRHSVMSSIHDYSGFILGLFVLIHLILHWKWIVSATKNIFRKK